MKRVILATLLLFLATPAGAVMTSHWTHSTEADWKPGTFHNVVATNLGDLKLSRAVKTLMEQNPKISAVYSLCETRDGTIYAGTGPQGVLLQLKDDKVSTVLELEDGTSIFSLLEDTQGRLLMGTGGEKGRIYRIEKTGDKPRVIFEDDDVQYVWAMVKTPDGNLYAATGPNGKLFEIKPDGSHAVIVKTGENNLLSMVSDGKETLYVGTDPNGLVYKVNRHTHESFVLYDAPETEISALALDSDGSLYAGTSEASDQPPAADDAEKAKIGRPEGGPGGVPIQAEPPANPAPPPAPNPNPGQPHPLPQAVPTFPKMDILPGVAPSAQVNDDGDNPGKAAPPGADPGKPATPASNPAKHGGATPQQGINTTPTGAPAPEGNAIYRIDTEGFVTEVFRQPALVFSIIAHDGTLLVATGSDGLVYQVRPAAEETVVVAKVDPKQVTALLPTADGRIIMGMSNVGALASMGSGFAAEGSYISPVLDATQISRFGEIQLHGTLPPNTAMKVSTRSGNVKEPSETSWSKWSPDAPAAEFVASQAPAARFFQYRLMFATEVDQQSPVIEDVDVAYRMPNLAPVIKSVKVALSTKSGPQPAAGDAASDVPAPVIPSQRYQTISWEATDPNADPLLYSIYYRNGSKSPWILLKDKLKDATFEWDTRNVGDGRYELKVVASDAAANPVGQGKTASRLSDPVLVDNTAPVIGDLKAKVTGTSVQVDLRAVDRTSIVAAVDYALDSGQDWQAVEASDKIFDSPEEAASFTVAGLSPGPHQITVRATDSRGNQAFENVSVTIEAPAVTK